MRICFKSPHQPCNVNRIWIGTSSENFHIKFHTTPNHSPQTQVNFKSHCLRKGIQNCTIAPRKCVTILTITIDNAAADVLAVHRQAHCPVIAATDKYGQMCSEVHIFWTDNSRQVQNYSNRYSRCKLRLHILEQSNLGALQDEQTQVNRTYLPLLNIYNAHISNDKVTLFTRRTAKWNTLFDME